MKKTGIFVIALTVAAFAPGAMAGSGPAKAERAGLLLESVKQEYNACQRLDALKGNKSHSEAVKPAAAEELLKKVDLSEVNMATNRLDKAGKREFRLNGKTYYISGDKDALQLSSNPTTCFAKDPLTNKTVNKADAVTYADASGRVHYFESEDSYKGFIGLASK